MGFNKTLSIVMIPIILSFSANFVFSDDGKENWTQRETELIQRIESLEKKVQELEVLLKGKEQTTSTATTSENVSTKENVSVSKPEVKKEDKSSTELVPQWKDRLSFKSQDGSFELQVGGRVQLDWVFFDNDGDLVSVFGEEDDGTQFRRAKIDISGKIYDSVLYRMEFDFAGDKDMEGRAKFTNTYIGLSDIPYIGNIQVGHFREPFGMERLTSSNYNTFMERGFNDVFNPKRNVGIMLFNSHLQNRLIWQAGIFKETDDFPSDNDSDDDQGYAVTGRIVGIPWYEDKGRKLLHLGLAYSHRNPDGAPFRYKANPECALAFSYLDTDRYAGFRIADAVADDVDLIGSELLWIYGPFSIQAEQALSCVDTNFGGTREFQGGYIYTSYFFTGENRTYNNKMGTLSRIKPKNNFSPKTGSWGAWELGLRYSWIDLDSGMIRGGKEQDWTLGLNWYLNPNTRVFLNYTLANIEHDLYNGNLGILQTRFQIDF
ncbi:MAG: porin [Candidatus Hydrogenedens sp.]